MYARMNASLDASGIVRVDPTERLGKAPEVYFDRTNHFHDEGNVEMARIMRDVMETHPGVERTPAAGRRMRRSSNAGAGT